MISVVVPIYNVEKYLERCIQSIVTQTYRNLEIILVDDGSSDRCPLICDEWAERDDRVKVIHKENAGLGFARNTGIENAHGEYICFFDSDDYVENNVIEQCYIAAKRENADMVCFGNDNVAANGEVLRKRIPTPPQSLFVGNEIRERLIPRLIAYDASTGENWNLSMSACFELISMNVIEKAKWRFVSEREIISEDFYSIFELYQHINRVFFLPKVFYHYTVNLRSLSRSYRSDRYRRIKHFAISMRDLSEKMKCNVEEEIATMYLGLLMGALRQIVASDETFGKKMCLLREILNDDYLQKSLNSNDFSGDNLPKRLLYWTMRRKWAGLCYFLAAARNFRGQTQ